MTVAELDDGAVTAAAQVLVSARHEAELDDGSRVLLLDDRGLIRGTHPGWSPRPVTAALARQADWLPCPPGGGYDPDGTGAWLARCKAAGRAGAAGAGQVDVLDAVTR